MVKEQSRYTGFTLIETVIYIALLSVITTFMIGVLYQIIGSQNQNRSKIEVESEANFMLQKIGWALSGAQTINQPAVNATASTLSVNRYTASQNPVVFDFASSTLRIARGTNNPAPLGSGRVYVSQVLFTHIASANGEPEGVNITLSVVASDTSPWSGSASTTLTDTIYLRK